MHERPNEAYVRPMEVTPEAVIDFAAQRAREIWDEKREPYLLALLSPELKARNIDYKAVLGEVRLKEYFQANGTDKVKLVSHPSQRSKIGLIPHNENFAYQSQDRINSMATEVTSALGGTSASARLPNNRYIVMNFLQLLSDLPKEEAEKVHIPASVLAMLLKSR